MKKFFKWFAIILASLIALIIIAAIILVSSFNSRMNKTVEVQAELLEIPTDSASIANGRHFIPLCQSCHGEALEGKVFFTDPKIGTIYSPNLTSGEHGIGKEYTDKDWILAIRHGVGRSGKPLFVMPSKDLHNLSAKDLKELIAYLKTIPPVDNKKGENVLPVITKILMQVGAFGEVFSSEVIDHKAPFADAPAMGTSPAYGKYLVNITGCATCHNTNMAGGKSPDPNSPVVPNLTPEGNLAKWSATDFISTMRTGTTPEKKVLDDVFMPWKHIGQLSDDDLTAIFNHLKSLPATPTPKS